jgi:AraC family transcriptional regulator, regulatory protein of adaptative response / methylated-DNA-[protein]-cysteine methyltransferase
MYKRKTTLFQEQVWAELKKIPKGETRTYQEVAIAIGRPNAARAVANACGANTNPESIPCHRVVRKNGELGGYRWGIAKKKQLLEEEKMGQSQNN